ncbi:MAG TPA: hypothetical protein VJX67_13765, partial [Blastocatellia bacterium]|nr:hypothetical protein [Blastocatellia bacterium]
EDVVFRRVGDDYIVVLGPARVLGKDALREALIRFVVDPMLERHLKTSLGFKDSIAKLVASVPGAAKPYSASVYLVMRESLAVAAEARIRRNEALEHGRPYSEDDVVYDLAQAYQRGAVLSFHFYDSLTGYQQVGIDLDDFIDQMLASTDFVREAARPKEFGPVLPRVEAARSRAAGAPSRSGGSVEPAAGDINSKVMESDFLIRQRKYSEAKPMLEQVLSKTPDNARALYGMAQVVNQMPSQVESDPNADENDKIQAQHDRLEKAIKLYREAIQKADPGSENWIVQWSHVLIARILDFQEFRTDALAEYNKAVEMGEVPSGAYKEAVEGKQHPFGQK